MWKLGGAWKRTVAWFDDWGGIVFGCLGTASQLLLRNWNAAIWAAAFTVMCLNCRLRDKTILRYKDLVDGYGAMVESYKVLLNNKNRRY